MSCDVMCRADVLWVLYAVCGCVLCMVCAVCVLYCAIFTVKRFRKCINIDNKLCATSFRYFLPDSKTAPQGIKPVSGIFYLTRKWLFLGKKTVGNHYQIQK